MTTTPDYKIIDAAMEVARPERGGLSLYRYTSSLSGGNEWVWKYGETGDIWKQLDTPDALAVVEKAFAALIAETGKSVSQYRDNSGEWFFSAAAECAHHPDRTTALCLLALRVAGVDEARKEKT